MYLKKANSENIVAEISKLQIKDNDTVLILLGEKNKPNVIKMISALNAKGIDFFGGVFPGIIYGEEKYDEGAIIKVLPILEKPFLIKGLDAENITFPNFGKKLAVNTNKQYTAIILMDGLTSNISLFLSELFNRLGDSVHYFGGGAGSITLERRPCIFTTQGFIQDAAVVAFVRLESILGVHHGWKQIMGPIVATKTYKNIILELNWRNAFEVYSEVVNAYSNIKLTQENFFEIAKGYPFGIYKEGSEDIVRDPIAANEKGEITCVGEIPENTVLNILKGNHSSLIQAAGHAADECHRLMDKKLCHSLIVDCISRVLFLEEDFVKELAIVKKKISSINNEITPEGVLTLGEISSYGEGFLEFFNKTIVIGLLYE